VSIGTSLRVAREQAGLSIADVSRETRIRGTLIGQIEADNWSGCGGDVYARGHLRAIAHVVGLDAVPLIAEFDRDQGHGEVPELHSAMQESTGAPRIRERRGPNWMAFAVGAAAVTTALLGASYFANGGPSSGVQVLDARRPAPSPPASTSAPASPSAPSPATAAKPPPLVAQLAPVVVVLKISQPSWVLASSSGKDFGNGEVLQPGATKQFTSDKPITVTVGNAGGVDFTVNGKHIGTAGAVNEVQKPEFGPETAATGQG